MENVGKVRKPLPIFISEASRLQITLNLISYLHTNCLELSHKCKNEEITVTLKMFHLNLKSLKIMKSYFIKDEDLCYYYAMTSNATLFESAKA